MVFSNLLPETEGLELEVITVLMELPVTEGRSLPCVVVGDKADAKLLPAPRGMSEGMIDV